jgi:hypothetical protein
MSLKILMFQQFHFYLNYQTLLMFHFYQKILKNLMYHWYLTDH